jgi:hypothetical protein
MGKKKPTSKKPVKYSPTSDSIPKIQLGDQRETPARKKKIKDKEFKFNVLNIKIISDKPVKESDYKKLFEESFENRRIGQISGENHGIIRQLFHDNENSFLYGIFCRFVKIENQALDINSLEIVNFEIGKNLFPNPREASFVFFPDLHRIGIYGGAKISLSTLQKMLISIFNAPQKENRVDVYIEQSTDAFDRILKAKMMSKIHIEISPSNADVNKSATLFMDKEIKKMGAGKLSADINPNAKGTLNAKGSKMFEGLLGLAKSNGYVKATIINEQEKKEVINTSSHPELFKAVADNTDNARVSLYNNLKKRFRNE